VARVDPSQPCELSTIYGWHRRGSSSYHGPHVNTGATHDRVLLAGLSSRHLEGAVEICRAAGRVVLPAGSPGDLDLAPPGTEVLLMISGEDAVPAATWRATLVRRIEPSDDGYPDRVPVSWLEDRLVASDRPAPDDVENEQDEGDAGPQSYFEVERLEPLPKQDWVFANELVRKQERGGRAFFPRAPRLIRTPA
jgi:hypothetical protein